MFIPNSPSPPSGTIHNEGLLNCSVSAHFLRLSYHTERFCSVGAGRPDAATGLFEAQRFNRIQLRRFLRRIEAKEQSHKQSKRSG